MSDSTTTTTPHTLTTTGRDYNEGVSIGAMGRWSTHIVKRAAAETANYVMAEIARQDAARQSVEDARANHRNLNRMLTLLGALFIGLALTFMFTHPTILESVGVPASTMKTFEPYTFVITIFLDSSLAAYSFFKKY